MINNLPSYMINSLLITLGIEGLMSVILGIRKKSDFIMVMLVNVLTNPIVVSFSFLAGFYFGLTANIITLIVLELAALACEGFIYSKTLSFKKINPYLFSFILNVSSYFLGQVINRFIY